MHSLHPCIRRMFVICRLRVFATHKLLLANLGHEAEAISWRCLFRAQHPKASGSIPHDSVSRGHIKKLSCIDCLALLLVSMLSQTQAGAHSVVLRNGLLVMQLCLYIAS